MPQHQASPSAAEFFVNLTGGTTFNTVVIPPGTEPETLAVIDHITASTNNGTANGQMSIGSRGNTFYRNTIAATGGFTADLDFAGGFPHWFSSGTDAEPYRYPDRYDPNLITTTAASYPIFGGVAASGELQQAAGFSYTATFDLSVYAIIVRLQKVGNPTDSVNIDFGITDINTAPTNTSVNVPVTIIPTTSANSIWVIIPFSAVFGTTAGTKYYLRLRRTGARDTNNYVAVAGTTSGGPGSGGAYTLNNTTWSGESGTDDLAFRILAGIPITTIMPASSTASSLLVIYHYEDPAQIRV